MKDVTLVTLDKYVRSIRNIKKQDYAAGYARARIDGTPPPADLKNLSYMAAQAVRLNVEAIIGICEVK